MPIVGFLLLVFVIVLGAPALADGDRDAMSLRLKWIPQFQFAGYYAALERGYYADAGLDVAIHPGGLDLSAMQMVASGSDDFGIASPDQLFLAQDKGLDVQGVMAVYQASPTGLMVKRSSGIEGPEDFVGQTVGISFGELTEIEYRAILAAEGVSSKNINEVKKTYNLARFFNDQVPIWSSYVTDEPFQAEKRDVPVRVFTGADFGVDFYGDALFTKTKMIKDHPDRVRRFVSASRRGWIWAVQNPEAAIQMLTAYSEKPLDHLRFEAEKTLPLLESEATRDHGFGWQEPARFAYTQRKLKEAGLVDRSIPVEAVMTNQFLRPEAP